MLDFQIPELLQQKQWRLPAMEVLDEPGKPRNLFQPHQDPNHMEGEKFHRRQLNELQVVREKLWDSPNSPPKLRSIATRWFFIQDLEVDKEALEIALAELRQQDRVGVALRGKVGSFFYFVVT